MRNLVKLSVLLCIAALFMLLAVGFATAEEETPAGTAVRIGFETAGHEAKEGHYSVQALGGGEIASWYALDGWQDSGWIATKDIGPGTVMVEVLYYPGPGAAPTRMMILNHVPDDEYGWVSDGDAHALQVAWPDEELVCWVTDGEERTAYFWRSVNGTVHRTMVKDGKHDVYKPASMFDQPSDGWKLWDHKVKMSCEGTNATAGNYNDYLGADSPYWHMGGGK